MTRQAKPARASVGAEERAQRTRGITLEEWLSQPTAAATRQQVYLVAKLLATTAVNAEREQAKYRRWHRRLWAALQRLFAPPQVQVQVGSEPIEPGPEQPGDDTGEAEDPRPAELAAQKAAPTETLESGTQFRDKRGER